MFFSEFSPWRRFPFSLLPSPFSLYSLSSVSYQSSVLLDTPLFHTLLLQATLPLPFVNVLHTAPVYSKIAFKRSIIAHSFKLTPVFPFIFE